MSRDVDPDIESADVSYQAASHDLCTCAAYSQPHDHEWTGDDALQCAHAKQLDGSCEWCEPEPEPECEHDWSHRVSFDSSCELVCLDCPERAPCGVDP